MKKYRRYTGEKPYIFVTCSDADEPYCELILDKLTSLGYRIRLEDKGASTHATFEDLDCSHLMFLVLTESFIGDPPCYRLLQRAEEKHKPLIIYVPNDTTTVKEVLLRLIKNPEPTYIARNGDENLTDSKTANVLLDPTLGLTPQLAMKVFKHGLKLIDEGKSEEGTNYIILSASENCTKAILWLGIQELTAVRNGMGDYATAVERLFRAAKLGDTEAMYILGKMLLDGEGFERDAQLAYTYILKSAQHGFPAAQAELANMCDKGIGTDINKNLATKWYLSAAEKGEKRAYMPLGVRYLEGIYVEKNEQLAEKYLMKSAENGNADADLVLAQLYRDGTAFEPNKKRSAEHFKRAAEAGICEAQYFYAVMLRESKGKGAKERNKQAFYWLKRASDDRIDGTNGSPDAMYMLGNFYRRGIGCKKDPQKSFICYYNAAKLGHIKATKAVAESYRRGIGVPINKRAAEIFERLYQNAEA